MKGLFLLKQTVMCNTIVRVAKVEIKARYLCNVYLEDQRQKCKCFLHWNFFIVFLTSDPNLPFTFLSSGRENRVHPDSRAQRHLVIELRSITSQTHRSPDHALFFADRQSSGRFSISIKMLNVDRGRITPAVTPREEISNEPPNWISR